MTHLKSTKNKKFLKLSFLEGFFIISKGEPMKVGTVLLGINFEQFTDEYESVYVYYDGQETLFSTGDVVADYNSALAFCKENFEKTMLSHTVEAWTLDNKKYYLDDNSIVLIGEMKIK